MTVWHALAISVFLGIFCSVAQAECRKSLKQYCEDRWGATQQACATGQEEIKEKFTGVGIPNGCSKTDDIRGSLLYRAALAASSNAQCFDRHILPSNGDVCRNRIPDLILEKCCN